MRGVDGENARDELGKVLLQLDKVAVIEGGDAGLKDFGGDEFADDSGDGRGGGKFRYEGAKYFDDHRAGAGVTHPEDMGAEKYQRFED